MKRYRVWFAMLGVLAVPAVGAACWPLWQRPLWAPRACPPPMAYRPMYAPMYAPPPVYVAPPLCQPAVPVAPAVPAPASSLPPPRIESVPHTETPKSDAPKSAAPRTAVPSPAPAPGMGSAIPSPMPPATLPKVTPESEPVRPATGSDAPAREPDSTGASRPPAKPAPAEPEFPKVEIPKNLQTEPKAAPKRPRDPDMSAVPKVPAVGAPKDPAIPAIPSAAPAPESLIPPPSLPMLPDAKKGENLPSLTLPPDIPVAPDKKGESTSRSSPLTGGGVSGLRVSVFPAKGAEVPAFGYRAVGFYNHTNRDLALTIEGRAVKLPARSYLHAQLAPSFTWSHGERPANRETVPAGAGGVDVVFRD